MLSVSRRAFLGSSLAGLAPSLALGGSPPVRGVVSANRPGKERQDAAFRPSTLFLTWQRDPTTTMTVQWVGVRGETASTTIYYAPPDSARWQAQESKPHPYPMTDFKVFR